MAKSVNEVIYSPVSKNQKLGAIIQALKEFPGSTRHYLAQFDYHDTHPGNLGEDMSKLSLEVLSLIEKIELEKNRE